VDETHVSEEVLAVFGANDELGLPEFFVVRNVIV